jgi:hypothetical protein
MLSGASIFYFAVPETYSFASITILLALIFTVLTQQRTFSNLSYVAINMLTLSITTTNWMLGILSTWVNQRLKNTVQIMINAFFGVTVLWGIQKAIFPTSTFLLDISGERSFIFRAQTGGPLQVAESFFYHTLIVPTIRVVEEKGRPKWPGMYTQTSAPGSGTEYGIIAVLLWTILLTLGIWALFNLKNNQKLRMVLGASLLLQLILHIFYGTEIFVYSLHFIALLIPLAALATLTRARPFVLALTTVLILLVASNNLTQFYKAIDFFRQHGGIPHA